MLEATLPARATVHAAFVINGAALPGLSEVRLVLQRSRAPPADPAPTFAARVPSHSMATSASVVTLIDGALYWSSLRWYNVLRALHLHYRIMPDESTDSCDFVRVEYIAMLQ